MDDIFVYTVKMPPKIKEFVTPCLDGYTVYIDDSLSDEEKREAYNHAMKHIERNDFENTDIQEIEYEAHIG